MYAIVCCRLLLFGLGCRVCCLSLAVVLRKFLVGHATARMRRNRIYEKTGGKGKEVGRQIGHHRTAKHEEPQEATGVKT